MKAKRLNLNRLSEWLYWIVTFFVFAFVANNDAKFIGELLVFYIPGTKWLVHFLFLLAHIVMLALITQRIAIDNIEVILLLKLICDIVSTCMINKPDSFAFILWANIGVFSYIICRNSKLNLQNVLDLFELFALLLSFQTIITGFMLFQNGIVFESTIFKSRLRIPFAGSNLVSGVVSSAMICVLSRYESQKTKKVFFSIKLIIYIVALLVIRSRGSILLLFFILDWMFLKRIKSLNNSSRRVLLYILLIVVNLSVVIYALNSAAVEMYFSRYLHASSDITSGRLQIWQYAWEEFIRHPILGRGISFESDRFTRYTGAHNIWLDTLMSTGVIGFLLHFILIYLVINRIRMISKNRFHFNKSVFACTMALTFLYLDSLVEVSYYNYINDVIFWSLCGALIADICDQRTFSVFITNDIVKIGDQLYE